MEVLNEFINNGYPLVWMLSGGIALAIWAWASRKRARLDIKHATKLIVERRYRNWQMRNYSDRSAGRYKLKDAILELGLKGYFFETGVRPGTS
ncbi:hypothetical protein BH23BAC3_BH23BAC3_31380 [soil metagenome]